MSSGVSMVSWLVVRRKAPLWGNSIESARDRLVGVPFYAWGEDLSNPQWHQEQIVDARAARVRIRRVRRTLTPSRGSVERGVVARRRGQERTGQTERKYSQTREEVNATMYAGQWACVSLPLKYVVFKVKWVMVEPWCFPGETDRLLGIAPPVLRSSGRIVDFQTGRDRARARRDVDIDGVNRSTSFPPGRADRTGPTLPTGRLTRRRGTFFAGLR